MTKSPRCLHTAYVGIICLTLMSCSAAASATDTGAEQTETAHFLTVPAMNSPTLTPTLVHTLKPAQTPTTTRIPTQVSTPTGTPTPTITWPPSGTSTSTTTPTSTSTAMSTLTATPTPTGTVGIYALQPPDPENITWKVYRNEKYGFEFEYPAIYDEYELEGRIPCILRDYTNIPNYPDKEVVLGSRTFLSIQSEKEDVEVYVKQLFQREDLELTSWQIHTVAGVEAISVEYEFGGMRRRGWATFFKQGDTLYSISYSLWGGSTCDFGQMGFGEIEIYAYMVTSFRFLH